MEWFSLIAEGWSVKITPPLRNLQPQTGLGPPHELRFQDVPFVDGDFRVVVRHSGSRQPFLHGVIALQEEEEGDRGGKGKVGGVLVHRFYRVGLPPEILYISTVPRLVGSGVVAGRKLTNLGFRCQVPERALT